MSSRFPPVHESRYPPRARSRSPPRYEGWRPNGPPNPGFNNNNNNRHGDFERGLDPPRGPRTFNDNSRGPPPGPGSGPSAPLGPRGRGAPPRPEFRELRDAPPLGTDRSFRERDFDRRARPISPRARSPVRGFRDGPPPPRDLDLGRGRRDSRDGPINAGPGYTDAPPFGQASFGRGGFNGRGRGRGRGDFGFRRGPADDRNTFRPRDRSPPPTRWGSVSRGDRDDWRPERREDDRWLDRDDREREPDRFRRDPATSRFDSRPPTPHQQASLAQPPAERAPPFESSRDDSAMRRPSTTSLTGVKEPLRRDLPPQNVPSPMPLPPNDLLAGRVESSAARYGSRASSPPPSAPQVPAFGSLSFKSQPYSGPTSNVWKASPENRATATPAKPPVPSPPTVKPIPTAPKAQLAAPPPAAPRAPRALENAPPTAPRESFNERAPPAPQARISSAPQPPAPTGPWALRTDDRVSGQFAPAAALEGRRLSGSFQPETNNTPTSPRTLGPGVAQMAQMTPIKAPESLSNQVPTPQTQSGFGNTQDGRAPRADMAPPRLGTPPPAAPSGPRNAHTFSTSPVMQNPNIPTAPKAIRGPPMAPRASVDRGQPLHRPMDRNGLGPSRVPPGAPRAPAWNQWIRPGAPQYREPTVPAKRDLNGDEKTHQFMPRTSPQIMNRQISDPSSMRTEEVKDDRAFKTAPVSPERRSSETTAVNNSSFQKEFSVPSPVEKTESDLAVDADVATPESSEDFISDEEGMDLDEEDFAQSKAKFERQKAHLEAQMIDLNARQYRATTPLAQIVRLANVTVRDLPSAQNSIITEAKDDIMEGMETSEASARAVSPLHPPSTTTQEDMSNDLIVPKQEQLEEAETVIIPPVQTSFKQPEPDRVLESAEVDQNEDIDMDGSEDLDFITPEPKRSIEAITLPHLAKTPLTPLSDLGAFHENIARLNAAKPALIMHYQAQAEEEQMVQKDLQEQYVEKYRAWKLETQLLDRERASKETEERQMSVELGLDIESSPIMENPISESSRSRLHKFSSEYDIQQVLKQSEETARLEQEKVERESRRAQIDLEKEAIPPEMWDEASKEKRIFKNMNRYRDPICLTDIYGYEPEFDTFTETEHKRFVELFKERPKQWGEIAAQLPGRSYADCIHHYYKYKWDGRFKEKQKRRAKGGGRRGGKTGRAKPATLMSDLRKDGEEDSSSGPMLTETGRPRRAATRTAYTAEKDPETKPTPVAPATNKKVPATGEVGSEKPAKRRKTTAAGDKPQKRGRQTLVSTATSVTSPAGTDKEVVLSQEDFARAKQLEEAALLTGIYTGTRALGGPQPVEYAHDPLPVQVPNETAERIRAPAQTSMQRSSASSYWSVPEQTDFVKFIAHFGTDFGAIANHMGTKTQTMVKNYYQRLVESGNRPDVVDAANIANARRDRGEDMGIPPTPTPINKRRYDNPGPTLPRTASGSQGEVMDIDPVPPTQPSTLSQPSSQFQHQYRFSMTTQPTPAVPQRAAPSPLQPHESPALGKSGPPSQPRGSISSSGPKMGFFSESRMERRPTLPGSDRPAQQPSPSLMHQQQPTPPGLMHQNLSHLTSEFVKNLKEEQERALSIQKRASQEHVPQVVQHSMFQPPAAQTSAPTGSPQLSMLDRPLERDERSGTPGVSSLVHPRAGPGMFRNIIGSPGPMASSAISMHPPFRSGHVPSPPKREEPPIYRPGSVPAPSPATSVVKPAMSLATGPPAEPRKTSNLASLLNSEPEEPRQKKRVGDQPTPFTQSPTPSTLSVAPSGPGSSIFPPRRDVFNQTPVSRQEYDGRSSYPQPTSHAPTPAAQHELMTGRSGTPVGSRQPEWQSRPPMGHNLASSSPHPPAPLERDVRPYFSHRANLGSLNPQSRANPSPPPNAHPYMNHSRTPSVSGRPMTPSQLQPQGPSNLSHMAQAQTAQAQSQIMQANPYPQQHGGPSHMQQMQAHQQNQYSHRHNSSGGSSHSGLHQRQTSRGEEMSMLRQQQQQQQQQEREFHFSREREHRMEVDRQYKEREAQFHQHQQQEQQRYAQHRTPQPFQQQPLSGPPQILSMREQARIEAEQGYRDARNREQYEQEMHIRRIQEDEERMRYDYRNPSGMLGRNSGGGYGGNSAGFPPPGPHRR